MRDAKVAKSAFEIWLEENEYTPDEQLEVFSRIIAVQEKTSLPEYTISVEDMAVALRAYLAFK